MASQLIGTTETGWFNPGVNPPPFDMKLLLMVAGSRSEDCGRTFDIYTVVMTAYVQQQGPGDEYDDETAFDEYMAGDKTDFLDFQFDMKDENGEVLDWYSNSIVAWAYYPLGIAQTAVNVECDGTRSHLEAATAHRTKLRDMLWDVPASMSLTDPELRAGVELQRKEIDRLKQQLRDEGDRIAELKRAIESMRVAGGSVEFQLAFDMAKALIVTPNVKVTGSPALSASPRGLPGSAAGGNEAP